MKKNVRVTAKKREYTLEDLVAIAEQLGARVRFELIPKEAFGPKKEPTKRPAK